MGAPAKKDGKACEGFKIFTGGKIGENPELAKDFAQVGGGLIGENPGFCVREELIGPTRREVKQSCSFERGPAIVSC